MRRSRLFGWGVAVAVGVLCGLIAQSGCSAVRALSAPNWYAPDRQGRFSGVVDYPQPPSPTPTRKLIEATMCPPIVVVALQAGELFCSN